MVVELQIEVRKFVGFGIAEDVQEIVISNGDLGVNVVEFVDKEFVGLCVRRVASEFDTGLDVINPSEGAAFTKRIEGGL